MKNKPKRFQDSITIKLKNFLSHKSNNFETITLVGNDMVIISDDQKTADIFIEYFDTN